MVSSFLGNTASEGVFSETLNTADETSALPRRIRFVQGSATVPVAHLGVSPKCHSAVGLYSNIF
jgi:hypothetical protein